MAIKQLARQLETPDTVLRYGWRDEPVKGKGACTECAGWGCHSKVLGDLEERRVEFKTCGDCGGTGHT